MTADQRTGLSPFASFFMGGYECADHVNRHGQRVNLLRETAHDRYVEQDYEAIVAHNIYTVREGICWSSCEPSPFNYDFSEVVNRMRAAQKFGIQQLWDICHFGFPDDLSPTHPAFIPRFAGLCKAFVSCFATQCGNPLFITPINEISFLSWLGGNVRGTVPFMVGAGWDLKYHLCAAAVRGIEEVMKVCPTARIITVEPLIRIHPRPEDDSTEVEKRNDFQYQAMDILGGRLCPELGGRPEYLDILGCNYYYNCQWMNEGETLPWPADPTTRIPLSVLLHEVSERYGRPLLLSETGHFGNDRSKWLDEAVAECRTAMANHVPLLGICIYPIVDRPDWDNVEFFVQSGLFDMHRESKQRSVSPSYASALKKGIRCINEFLASSRLRV